MADITASSCDTDDELVAHAPALSQLGNRALERQPPSTHEANPIGETRDQRHLMRTESDRRADCTYFADELEKDFLIDRIETGKRFIQNCQARSMKDCGGELHLLLISLGQRLDQVIPAASETEAYEPRLRDVPRFARREPCNMPKKASDA